MVEYDLDIDDFAWLEQYNKEHPKNKLSEDALEFMIDRFEKALDSSDVCFFVLLPTAHYYKTDKCSS